MKESTAWVAPLESLPASLKPIAAMQKKHFGAVLNPTRWWGRMPRLFWLVALFVGFLERRHARLTPALRSLLMTRVSQLCHCARFTAALDIPAQGLCATFNETPHA